MAVNHESYVLIVSNGLVKPRDEPNESSLFVLGFYCQTFSFEAKTQTKLICTTADLIVQCSSVQFMDNFF